ncbi:MAG: anaerobic benzoate catabolism transcriptional regulator [Planctomycetaceae bacterium]|nr:anaerobic benzoate catabolism transcriptional regulator [Planctomycetaceae bacterium]
MARMDQRAKLLKRFGQRVRALRKAQGYSQESLGAACELDRTYIGGIERGERNVSLENINAIASSLGLTLAQLLEGV